MVPEGLPGASEAGPPSKPSPGDARILPAVGSVGAQRCRVCWPRQVCLRRPPCLFARKAACSWRTAVCPPSSRGALLPPGTSDRAERWSACWGPSSSRTCGQLPVLLGPPLPPIRGLGPRHQPPSVSLNPRCCLSGRASPGPLRGQDAGASGLRGGQTWFGEWVRSGPRVAIPGPRPQHRCREEWLETARHRGQSVPVNFLQINLIKPADSSTEAQSRKCRELLLPSPPRPAVSPAHGLGAAINSSPRLPSGVPPGSSLRGF